MVKYLYLFSDTSKFEYRGDNIDLEVLLLISGSLLWRLCRKFNGDNLTSEAQKV